MKSLVKMRLPIAALSIAMAFGLSADAKEHAAQPPVEGPQADYPMVLGQPFVVDGITYTPADTQSYDAVGYAAATVAGGAGISGSHRTLPLPSYVEVTALETGRTILVRLERRGPMTGSLLIDLSPAAAAQLGITGQPRAPVRVRRVNPPEMERAALRSGQPAPMRMETPPSLRTVLLRRLAQQGVGAQVSRPGPMPTPDKLPPVDPRPTPSKPGIKQAELAPPPVAPPSRPPRAEPAATGAWTIQIGAYSTKARADAVAAASGGRVQRAGNVFRVRLGAFATRAAAEAALTKARAAGHSDARVQSAD